MSLPQLSPSLLSEQTTLLPEYDAIRKLPEKVVQFGTGVLLRGLPDYFIDKANRNGLFNGRVLVVKSTGNGKVDAFSEQDNLYTHCIRGIEDGRQVDETLINSAISRTLSAATDWETILKSAESEDIRIVISNTTEVGIQLTEDDLYATPPASFPGKLTAYLLRRFQAFGNSPEHGLVIIPTELLPDNGQKLKDIVIEQARRHHLGANFIDWISTHNRFCSSLVDRIVPGRPAPEVVESITAEGGYRDDLLIMSEVYRLWAIEGDEKIKSVLSFAEADNGVIIAPDIDRYRELKLRLLNGTHTLCVGLCYLYGKDTVRESMETEVLEQFIAGLMLSELGPAIPYAVDRSVYEPFGNQVLDRFRNPAIRHQLIDITVQYTAKMRMRNIPTLLQHYQNTRSVPTRFAQGFAAFLAFMKVTEHKDGVYYGSRNGVAYPIRCDAAPYFYEKWEQYAGQPEALTEAVLGDTTLWGTDLTALPGFAAQVKADLTTLLEKGAQALLQ